MCVVCVCVCVAVFVGGYGSQHGGASLRQVRRLLWHTVGEAAKIHARQNEGTHTLPFLHTHTSMLVHTFQHILLTSSLVVSLLNLVVVCLLFLLCLCVCCNNVFVLHVFVYMHVYLCVGEGGGVNVLPALR